MQNSRTDTPKKIKPILNLYKNETAIAKSFKFGEKGQVKLICQVSGISKGTDTGKNSYKFKITDIQKLTPQARRV